MNITSDIETMVVEMTRNGTPPQYIIMGFNQYKRWIEEIKGRGLPPYPDTYMGYDIIICNSDILEVVTDPKNQYIEFTKKIHR
ncbi:MAG: hypothetical protein LBT84_00390 [Spirochaetia bacterium]|jgi:hypothetical protein|nr:hypothetical protein [Spirochaetia bacterium]